MKYPVLFILLSSFLLTSLFAQEKFNSKKAGEVLHESLRSAMKSGNPEQALKQAKGVSAGQKLLPEDAVFAAVFVAAQEGRNLNVPGFSALNAEQQGKVMSRVANLYYLAGDYRTAKQIGATKLKTPPVHPVAVVREAPVGVHAWRSSALLKTAKRADEFVPYNQKAAELLVVDVNTVRGDLTKANAGKKCPLTFFVAADVHGLTFYGEMPEERASEIAAGILPGGALEMFLQPGEGEFYYQWLWNFFPETISFPDWMAPHKHYRPAKEFVKHEILALDNRICFYFRIGWEALYDRLPDETSQWRLGVIPWIDAGGFTWGSGGQVHELNLFGRLEFKGIGKILPEIKHRMVLSAWGRYKTESAREKIFWHDEVHGDRAFYKAELLPLLNKLDAAGKQVSAKMSPQEAEELFRTVVPQWFEIKYEISGLRRDYLMRSQLQ